MTVACGYPSALLTAWADATAEAVKLTRAEHAAKLHPDSRRFDAYDARGEHVLSELFGRIRALEALAPDLFAHPAIALDSLALRRAAREGAVADYDESREADWRLRFLLEQRGAATCS